MKINGIHRGINWNRQPLVRPLILFISGLLCADFLADYASFLEYVLLVLLSILFAQSHLRFLNKTLVSCTLYASFFLLGVFVNASPCPSGSEIPEFKNYTLLIKQSSDAVCKGSGDELKSQFTAEAKSILIDKSWHAVDGVIKFTIKNDSLTSIPGDLLLVHANFKKPTTEILPGSFDSERFCRIKSIDALCTLNKYQLIPLAKNEQHFVFAFILNLRRAIIRYLKTSGFDSNQVGIASALLVGYRADIDAELNNAYSKAGIIHVLAVSGMHVSLVFGSVLWLLGRFLKPRNAAIAGILVLWFYALLAGLSASVLRSACMFSLLAISKLLVKSTISSNAMAGAAFIMLIVNPQTLYDPGAQLSFAAVWGIYARAATPSILFFRRKFIRYVIDSIWICMVAQLATLPITLWYFGSFPVYFLLANLVAVPFSTGLIYLGFISLILFPLGFVSEQFLELMKIGIDILNFFTLQIAGLPLSSIDFGRFTFIEVLFSGCIIYTVLFPMGSLVNKVYTIGIARLIYSAAIILTSIRIDNGPDLYFFSCERTYHFVSVGTRSVRLINIGSEQGHTCNRTNGINQFAQKEGRDLKMENHTIHNLENGGKAYITYIFDNTVHTLTLQIYSTCNLANLPSTDKSSHAYCRQFNSSQKMPFLYSAVLRRRVLPIGFLNSYKIR